jgi:transcriptional regulator with XRE-family HTH domain
VSSAPLVEFGRYIRELRESKQWSRDYLEEFGISKSTVERWENGEISRPRRSTFEQFAKAFDLNVDDLIKRYKNSTTFDTVQATNSSLGNDTTFTPIPNNATEPTAPSPNKWNLIQKVVAGIVIVSLLVLAVYALILNSWHQHSGGKLAAVTPTVLKPVDIKGKVLCPNSEPVVDIWVDVFEGNTVNKSISGHVDLRNPNSNGSETEFVYTLRGDAYNLHVGCGGTQQHWKGVYKTDTGSGAVHDHKSHYFICHDAYAGIDYGSCELQY